MKAYHEYDERGRHRLGISTKLPKNAGETSIKWGKWVGYTTPAVNVAHRSQGRLVAVTDYYKDSAEFPDPTKLYEVTEAKAWTFEDIIPEGAKVEA